MGSVNCLGSLQPTAYFYFVRFYSLSNHIETVKTSTLGPVHFPRFRAGQTAQEWNLYSFQSGEGN